VGRGIGLYLARPCLLRRHLRLRIRWGSGMFCGVWLSPWSVGRLVGWAVLERNLKAVVL
jgi:hypothetical protein